MYWSTSPREHAENPSSETISMRNTIRTMRLLSDLSLDEAAQHLHVDPFTLREWENDASLLPTLPLIHQERLSRLFRMSDDEISTLFLPSQHLTPRPNTEDTLPSPAVQPPSASQHQTAPMPVPSAPPYQRTATLLRGGHITLATSVPVLALSSRERHLLMQMVEAVDDLCELGRGEG
jgi:DNA-binding XRE family transcriptional regulator